MTTVADVERRAPGRAVEFKADAMLMYGWVADANRHVRHVSNSLQRWVREHRSQAGDANRLLDLIETSGDVRIEGFLQSLLDPESEGGTGELVGHYMDEMEQLIGEAPAFDSTQREEAQGYAISIQYHPARGKQQPLAGVRFVRDSATLLASRRNGERVDIVVVAILEPHEHRWRLEGFQGQLQEAWLRVSRRIVDGNRAAGLALMARNMSHNIGSHALHWVASEYDGNAPQRRFLTYMQERMELLAGFAIGMPLPPITRTIDAVIDDFKKTNLLLNNISRSEGVCEVTLNRSGYAGEAVFFGGVLGVHAFYSILENCIRDSAKHSHAARGDQPLTMHVVATPLERFIQIDIYDETGSFAESGQALRRDVEHLRLADDGGRLDEHHWGIKERFICASILRGIRPEGIQPSSTVRPGDPWLGTLDKNNYRILEMAEVKGNCSWRFYLPRRSADILLVTDRPPAIVPREVAVQASVQFATAVKSPVGILAPFVVLDGMPANIEDAESLAARLPHHTYVLGESAPHPFIEVNEPLTELSAASLLQRSVQRLASKPPRLILAVNEDEVRGRLALTPPDSEVPLLVIPDATLDNVLVNLHRRAPAEKFVIVKRHGRVPSLYSRLYGGLENELRKSIEYFECYGSKPILAAAVYDMREDPLRAANRLLEAALTKILILDERIDLGLEKGIRERLALRGITVRGQEFAGYASNPDPVSLATVGDWARHAHFVMLHRGIVEKLSTQVAGKGFRAVVGMLEKHGGSVVIHSGRMGVTDMPPQTKFLSLTNVAAWVDREYSKVQIVDELFSLRRI